MFSGTVISLFFLFFQFPVYHGLITGLNTEICCQEHGVSDNCNMMLCNPQKPPDDFDVYNIFERKLNCLPYMSTISKCLANGRDHMHCCLSDAKDRDENVCFGMCRGEPIDGITAWDKYQTCLAINLHSMYRCFQRGYSNIPSPPQSVQLIASNIDSVTVTWRAPAENANLVESYLVICKDVESDNVERSVSTRAFKATLTGLRADSKYSLSVIAVTRDGRRRSLPSDITHFDTLGVAPRAVAYRENVAAPPEARSVTIACRIQLMGSNHKSTRVEWMRESEKRGLFELISGEKYSLTSYTSAHGHPRHYVSTLQIKFWKQTDYGRYRCVAYNNYGSSSADIVINPRKLTSAVSIPPEPPYICCERLGIRSPCIAVCGSEFGKRASLRAEAFMNSRCENEIGKFLTCTVAGVDEGACCLRKKVPGICLSLCDGSQMQTEMIPHICAPHTFSIFQCRMENADSRPATVSGLKAIVHGDSILIRWDKTDNADIYHVYWRRKTSNTWEVTFENY